jgi:hypothetical protein
MVAVMGRLALPVAARFPAAMIDTVTATDDVPVALPVFEIVAVTAREAPPAAAMFPAAATVEVLATDAAPVEVPVATIAEVTARLAVPVTPPVAPAAVTAAVTASAAPVEVSTRPAALMLDVTVSVAPTPEAGWRRTSTQSAWASLLLPRPEDEYDGPEVVRVAEPVTGSTQYALYPATICDSSIVIELA